MVEHEKLKLVCMMTVPRPPNILFILTDQQRYDTLACNGASFAKTPNLDRLAKSGASFHQHVVANPVCSPSRASIWTGQAPSAHGLWANGGALDSSAETIASHLTTHGYQTAHFGKMHLVPILNRVDAHPAFGFQKIEVAEGDQQYPPDDAYFNWLRAREPMRFAELLEELYTKGQADGYASRLPRPLHQSEWTTDRASDWLQNERDENHPFFLSVGFFDPHHAFNPVREFWDLFEETNFPPAARDQEWDSLRPEQYATRRQGLAKFFSDPAKLQATIRAYHAMVAHVDACIGRLLDALKTTGLDNQTLIVFSSDHGELLGDHGMLWKGPFLLDSLMRVPLIMAGPGIPAGHRFDAPTSSLDFFPTFARLAGADTPHLPGRSLLRKDGTLEPPDPDRLCYAEWDAPGDGPASCLRMLRSGRDKIIINPLRPEIGEYYDLISDPHECRNRWNAVDPRQQELRNEILTLWHRPHPDTPVIEGW